MINSCEFLYAVAVYAATSFSTAKPLSLVDGRRSSSSSSFRGVNVSGTETRFWKRSPRRLAEMKISNRGPDAGDHWVWD